MPKSSRLLWPQATSPHVAEAGRPPVHHITAHPGHSASCIALKLDDDVSNRGHTCSASALQLRSLSHSPTPSPRLPAMDAGKHANAATATTSDSTAHGLLRAGGCRFINTATAKSWRTKCCTEVKSDGHDGVEGGGGWERRHRNQPTLAKNGTGQEGAGLGRSRTRPQRTPNELRASMGWNTSVEYIVQDSSTRAACERVDPTY
jgi:hypothetical protein